jgi:4-alpha-glucanotransferase
MHRRRFRQWVTAHGGKDLFRYALEYHDDQIEIHNDLVQIMDNASARANQLEEALKQSQATITRLQRENEEDRLSRQNTPSTSHEPKRLTKLPDLDN